MIGKPLCLLLAFLALPLTIQAQERTQTLADIRQDLSVLYYELLRLNRELSTTQAPSGIGSGASVNDRLDAIEAELRRLTGATEKLEFRINQVVKDGTNRVGDLEFRLVELEGGDISTLGETSTLGGEVAQFPIGDEPQAETELAVGEEADFAMAQAALDEERYEEAAELFARFTQTYPSSPLTAEAHLLRGKALDGNFDYKASARAYLESFSNYPNASVAPEALMRLGKALVSLGQVDAGCQTLSQVEIRFPNTQFAIDAQDEMLALQCL